MVRSDVITMYGELSGSGVRLTVDPGMRLITRDEPGRPVAPRNDIGSAGPTAAAVLFAWFATPYREVAPRFAASRVVAALFCHPAGTKPVSEPGETVNGEPAGGTGASVSTISTAKPGFPTTCWRK